MPEELGENHVETLGTFCSAQTRSPKGTGVCALRKCSPVSPCVYESVGVPRGSNRAFEPQGTNTETKVSVFHIQTRKVWNYSEDIFISAQPWQIWLGRPRPLGLGGSQAQGPEWAVLSLVGGPLARGVPCPQGAPEHGVGTHAAIPNLNVFLRYTEGIQRSEHRAASQEGFTEEASSEQGFEG